MNYSEMLNKIGNNKKEIELRRKKEEILNRGIYAVKPGLQDEWYNFINGCKTSDYSFILIAIRGMELLNEGNSFYQVALIINKEIEITTEELGGYGSHYVNYLITKFSTYGQEFGRYYQNLAIQNIMNMQRGR